MISITLEWYNIVSSCFANPPIHFSLILLLIITVVVFWDLAIA